jgi:hypothetical protein
MIARVEATTAPAGRARTLPLLAGIVVAAAVIGRLPGPLGGWVQAIGTAAHESGHAFVADLLTGDVVSITVFRDGGGIAFTEASSSDWRSFLVAGAGYPATLLAGLALLGAVLLARSSRQVAAVGAAATLVALVLWTPFSARVPSVDDGDQRFTFFVLLLLAAALAGAAALPDRFDTARRVVLGAIAVGLLADAFRAGRDLVTIEGSFGDTATDADALAESSGILGATAWAWLLRLALFAVAAAWAWVLVRRMTRGADRAAP